MRVRCGQLGSLLCSPNARPQKVLAWVNGMSRRAGGDGVEKVVRNHFETAYVGCATTMADIAAKRWVKASRWQGMDSL